MIVNFLKKLIAYNWKYLGVSVVLFVLFWHIISFYSAYNKILKDFNARLSRNATEIYTLCSDKKDLYSLNKLFWLIKGSKIKSLQFNSKKLDEPFNDIIIGNVAKEKFSIEYQSEVKYNGMVLGVVNYSINYLELNIALFKGDVLLYIIISFFMLLIITLSNYGTISTLLQLESQITTLGAIDLNDTTSFQAILKSLDSKKKKSGIEHGIWNILSKFQEVFGKVLKLEREFKEHEKMAVIGKTTSSLSHDIRRPLSSIKLILDSFDMFKNNPSRLKQAKTDVLKSIDHIQGQLADIMNFSREVKLETEPNSIGPVFDFAIRQVVQSFSSVDIKFEYDFRATNKPLIDTNRLSRVLENIVGNGIEAITIIGKNSTGTIDITTNDLAENTIELTIGNDGPLFPKGIEKDLFESFYTSGKKSGTGLGLASAKKIVTLHEGEIFAQNKFEGNGVEFIIRLPASSELEDFDEGTLPVDTQDVFSPGIDEDEVSAAINKMKEKKDDYKVVLLDDEALYRAGVRNVINQNQVLKGIITLYETSTVEEALKVVEQEHPEYCIVDIDLNESKNGYDFLDSLKGKVGVKSIVHSNRVLEEDRLKAIEFGAKNLIPKPLPLSSLVEFLSGEKLLIKKNIPNKKSKDSLVLACDDTSIIRYLYEDLFNEWLKRNPGNFKFEIFTTGEELLEKAKQTKSTLVFTDLNMRDAGGLLDGYDVIKEIKKISRKTKVFLVSNEPLSLSEGPTKQAGGTGALEQPLSKNTVFSLLDKWVKC